ncbi:MAG: MBL fold metallo-hydrolase [Spirochaetaceae bacterium]|nr:MBL fold metallo-hydrolase [Spirochaetaceae bacterium]
MNAKRTLATAVVLAAGAALAGTAQAADPRGTVTYMGRATTRIVGSDGTTIYIDPYASGDYTLPADLILVTHGHSDHNAVKKCALKAGGKIAGPAGSVGSNPAFEAIAEGQRKTYGSVVVEALPAYNSNHGRSSSLGFLIEIDGKKIYHAGDTSYIPEMEALAPRGIDIALLPCDGVFNMGPEEASKCAEAIKPARLIPIHSSGSGDNNIAQARKVAYPGLLVLAKGESARLEP